MQAMDSARTVLVNHGYQIAIAFMLAVTGVYFFAIDAYWTWIERPPLIFTVYNRRDWLMISFVLVPLLAGHLITIWGHYFRADQVYHSSIQHVTRSQLEKDFLRAKKKNQKNPTHFWHRRWWGWTYKQWALAAVLIVVNFVWFTLPYIYDYAAYRTRFATLPAFGLSVGAASGYAVLACTAWILFLILRRSMLHALGWTYAELVPFHRWLGVLITFWSTVHTIGYLIYYIDLDIFDEGFNFTHERGLMNMFGVFAYIALLILAVLSIPWIRRKLYGVFMAMHRIMTVIYIIGTIAHFPYYMMWYYVLPSFVLFLLDRFVPKYILTRTILPTATVTLDPNGVDIMRITVRSRTPMKPYYPGDYILLQVPEIGTLYHPFTIASYYPEDPCAVTLYVRIYNESCLSWTPPLAMLAAKNIGHPVKAMAKVDGIFGDRGHDYLEADVCVLFVAGVAITTFMALIKAIGAQITAAKDKGEPKPAFRMYLICSFKTESEMYAYGTFFHQITTDPRFTSWLETRVFVTRSDPPKPQLSLANGDAQLAPPHPFAPLVSTSADAGKKKKTNLSLDTHIATLITEEDRHAGLGRILSSRTGVETPESRISDSCTLTCSSSSSTPDPSSPRIDNDARLLRSESVKTAVADDIESSGQSTSPPQNSIKGLKTSILKMSLPTFEDVDSKAESARLAHLDLSLSLLLTIVPLLVWFVSKGIYWEGYNVSRCKLSLDMSYGRAMYCFMTYSLIPGCLHFLVMSIGGYLALHMARKTMHKETLGAARGGGPEANPLLDPELELEEEKGLSRLALESRERHELAFECGRMDVEAIMREFIDMGIGGTLDAHAASAVDSDDEEDVLVEEATVRTPLLNKKAKTKHNGLRRKKGLQTATVLAGGPDSFVDRVEDQTKQIKWAVDFHRETWAP